MSQGCPRRLDRANGEAGCNVASAFPSALPKVIEHSETASKYFSNLLPLEDEPGRSSRFGSVANLSVNGDTNHVGGVLLAFGPSRHLCFSSRRDRESTARSGRSHPKTRL